MFDSGKSFSLSQLNQTLQSLSPEVTELDVHINSGGGLITEGFAIHDKLAASPYIVNTIVEGIAGSIATIIAQAPASQNKGGKRKIYENSEYFIHNPQWQPSGFDGFEADDLTAISDELKASEERIAKFYSNITGLSKREITDKMDEAKTLTAKDAKKLGFIDEIINTSLTAYTKYQLVAFTNYQINKKMDAKEVSGMFTNIQNSIDKVLKFFNNQKPAFIVTLPDGTTAFSEVEKPTKESKLYKDSAMTVEIPNTLPDAPVEPQKPNEAEEQLKAENEALKAKLAELETAKAEAETKVVESEKVADEAKVEVEKITTEFTNLKNKLVTGGFQNFVTEGVQKQEPAKFSALDEAARKISERLKK